MNYFFEHILLRFLRRGGFCLLLLLVSACDQGVNVSPLEQALGTALPVAWTANLALAQARGVPLPCVNVDPHCSEAGCGMTIDVGVNTCGLPLAPQAEGVISVQASVATPDHAIFSLGFAGVTAGPHRLRVIGLHEAVATRTREQIVVAFAGMDVEVGDRRNHLGETAWVILIDPAGTPDQLDDDIFTISGGDQEITLDQLDWHETGIRQMVLANVTMAPGCQRNPVAGFAVVNGLLHLSDVGLTGFLFHRECDGTIDVAGVLGPSLLATGSSVPIDLLTRP